MSKSLKELLTEDIIYDIILEKSSKKNEFVKDYKISFRDVCNEYLKDYINDDLIFNQAIELIQRALRNYHEEIQKDML